MCVMGSNPELGYWKQQGDHGKLKSNMMKWTEGDIWLLEDVQIDLSQCDASSKGIFMYKYVIVDGNNNNYQTWEEGYNRICDLYLL